MPRKKVFNPTKHAMEVYEHVRTELERPEYASCGTDKKSWDDEVEFLRELISMLNDDFAHIAAYNALWYAYEATKKAENKEDWEKE